MRLHENRKETFERVDELGRLRERIVFEKDIVERLISPNGKFSGPLRINLFVGSLSPVSDSTSAVIIDLRKLGKA